MTRRALLLILPTFLLASAVGRPQDSPFATDRPVEDRVRDLEAAVRRLEQASAPAAGPAPKADAPRPPGLTGWDDGFVLRSPDDRYVLRLVGQVQADYREFLDDEDTVDVPTFFLRRARLGAEASFLKAYEFRFQTEFGRGGPRVLDAFVNVRHWDEAQLTAGKFRQPFSFEQQVRGRFYPLVERSLLDQLTPARDVGLMAHGRRLFDDRLEYAVSVYNGVPNGDTDTDRNKEAAGRVVARPFRGLSDWLDGLSVGTSGTIGDDEGVVQPATLRTPGGVPWFQFARAVRPAGRRARLSPELVYVNGPLALAAQYHHETRDLSAGGLTARGFYVLAAWVVTGEGRTSFQQVIDPVSPFHPAAGCYGPGAWELAARVSRLELEADDPHGFARLADAARSAPAATEVTVGLNWYPNRWVRVQVNWEHAWFGGPVHLGGGSLDRQNALLFRLQLAF